MKQNFKTLNTFDMKHKTNILARFKQWILFIVMRSSSLRKANDKLNEVEFYDLMQWYRIAGIEDQDSVVKRFEEVKKWIRQNYA